MERARIREERARERQHLAHQQEANARSKREQKQAEKEAQLRAWQLEYEESRDVEDAIDGIANEAPEVEDRERLYAELAIRRVFDAEPFIAPRPRQSVDQALTLRATARAETQSAISRFRPNVGRLQTVVAIAALVVALGLFLLLRTETSALGAALFICGTTAGAGAHAAATIRAKRERTENARETAARCEAQLQTGLDALHASDLQHNAYELATAEARYQNETEGARLAFDAEEDFRLAGLADLGRGAFAQMQAVLNDALDIELPLDCPASGTVISMEAVSIDVHAPDRGALPTEEAKLLASGKVSYKTKPDRRLRDQYERLVAGLALRYASEVMLRLPTCMRVEVQVTLADVNPATGNNERRAMLRVGYDYATLAPLTMEGIDPVAALKFFEHELAIDRRRELRRADA